MPIYEYRCQACGHELEKLQRMSDAALTDCPDCGKSSLQRLISAAGFRLKGSGWYETDFKQGNKRNLAESSDTGSGGSPAANTAKSDSGSAAAPSKTSDSKSSDSKSSGSKSAAASTAAGSAS